MTTSRCSLVIGGTRGIGGEVARLLSAEGHRVAALGRKSPPEPISGLVYVQGDLEEMDQCVDALDLLESTFGQWDDLVFAQRYRGGGDDWLGEIRVTLSGTHQIIEHFGRRLGRDASIVVINSVNSHLITRTLPPSYHIAKAAIRQMVRYYAVTLGPLGVRVNSIASGTVIKPENRASFEESGQEYAAIARVTPLGRVGTAWEIASLVRFLCSGQASFITGQEIVVDGGASLLLQEASSIRGDYQ